MAQLPDDDDLGYYGEFQDIIAQRTMAFCSLAKVAAGLKDEAVKEQCMANAQDKRQHQNATISESAPSFGGEGR